MCSRRRVVWTGFVIVLCLTAFLTSSAYVCCLNFQEFAATGLAQGGVRGFGATCTFQSGGWSSCHSGGGSSNQQLMMGLAVTGATFAESLNAHEANWGQSRQ